MNELEEYLDKVCRPLRGAKSLRRHVREELREHLLEAAERHQADGAEPAEAIGKAIAEFGEPEMVRQGLQDVYGRPVMAMLIEKAMAWKERTMKTGWKWSFVAHLALATVLAGLVFFILFVLVFITPKLCGEYAELQVPLPAYAAAATRFAIRFCEAWFIWLPVVAVGWAVFERKCHSENKSVIRLGMGGLACVALTGFVFLLSVTTMVALVELRGFTRQQQRESAIVRKFTESAESVNKLEQALKQRDRQAARESQRALSGTFGLLEGIGTAEAALSSADTRDRLDETRRLLEKVHDATSAIGSDLHVVRMTDGLQERMLGALSRLKESYDQLAANVAGRRLRPRPTPTQPSLLRGRGF